MARQFDSKQFRTDLKLSGSFSGSFQGDGSQLSGLPTVVSSSYATTASYADYAVSASHEIIKEVSSSYADTASIAGGLFGTPSILVTNITASGDIILGDSQRIYFEADKATYAESDTTDRIRFVVGGTQMLLLDEDDDRVNIGYGMKLGVGLGNHTTPGEMLEVDGNISASGDITGDDLYMKQYLYHIGDPDTYLKFNANEANLVAGGKSAIKLELSTGKIQLNNTNQDLDTQIMGDGGDVLFHVDAGGHSVGIGTSTPPDSGSATLTVSGSISSSGIYYGDGSGLTNIPASGITGLNLSQIASGSATASISPNGGLYVNTNLTSSGNISASGIITAEGLVISDDANITDNLTVGGNLDIADTIYHTGDSNTKIRFPEVDTISFHTSGVERLRISPDGHITASGNVSSSITSTASFGTYLGDGAQLTGIVASNWTSSAAGISRLGDVQITGSLTISSSNSTSSLTLIGSGSTVFDVIGSVGTLFSVDDDLTGMLFTANDISGLPVLQASASGETFIGKSPQSLYDTSVISSTTAATSHSLCTLSTSSYDGAFFEYTAFSGSHDGRAGTIMAMWSASAVNYTETTTTDFGSTADLTMKVEISQSTAQLLAHATNAGYKIKTIIRSI